VSSHIQKYYIIVLLHYIVNSVNTFAIGDCEVRCLAEHRI